MNILVINGSPKGEYSITLQTVLYLQSRFPEHEYTTLHAGQKIKTLEKDFTPAAEALAAAPFIGADGTAVLRHDGGAMRFTLQPTDSVTEYILQGEDGDVRTLTIIPWEPWYVGVTGGGGAYTHIFVPAE